MSGNPAKMVHLGNHPEVTLCTRCAHSVSKGRGRSKTPTAPGSRYAHATSCAVCARLWCGVDGTTVGLLLGRCVGWESACPDQGSRSAATVGAPDRPFGVG